MPDAAVPDPQSVLRRAVQLDQDAVAPPPLGADAFEAAAAELGLAPTSVAMALAEARAGVATSSEPSRRRSVVGPREVVVVRSCRVNAPDAGRLAAEWFERGHLLHVTRRPDGTLVARRRSDPLASAERVVYQLRGRARLAKVREIQGGIGALADGTTAVCARADVSDSRVGAIALGSGVGVITAAGVGVVAVLASPFVALAAPVGVVVGVVVARKAHRDQVDRVTNALEETVDAVADGAPPPGSPLSALRRGLPGGRRR